MTKVQEIFKMEDAEFCTRRNFVKKSGLIMAAGAAVLAGCGPQPTPQEIIKTVEVTRPVEVTREVEKPVEVVKEMPAFPWQYVKLDVEEVRKRGHEAYYRGGCCLGAFAAVVEALREKVGYPFTHIPVEMMGFGAGGVAGWGTTCGSLIGASAAINLVTKTDVARTIVDELIGQYTITPFPSQISNDYAVNHQFLVAEYKSDIELPQSVSNSPLCHVSVSEWCKTSGYASGSAERAERCGRLTGDVAALAVELLNANADGTFAPTFQFSEDAQTCMACHKLGENFEAGNFIQGKGECLSCHEPHP